MIAGDGKPSQMLQMEILSMFRLGSESPHVGETEEDDGYKSRHSQGTEVSSATVLGVEMREPTGDQNKDNTQWEPGHEDHHSSEKPEKEGYKNHDYKPRKNVIKTEKMASFQCVPQRKVSEQREEAGASIPFTQRNSIDSGSNHPIRCNKRSSDARDMPMSEENIKGNRSTTNFSNDSVTHKE